MSMPTVLPTADPAPNPAERQRYSPWQDLRAHLYGRGRQIAQSLLAIGFIGVVVLVNYFYFSTRSGGTPPLQDAVAFLALQQPAGVNIDQIGTILLAFNLIFDLVFAQSIFNAVRLLLTPRANVTRQRGLATVLRGHVIVCGLGRVGIRVVTRLVRAGYHVAVIDLNHDKEYVRRVLAMRVRVLQGDARDLDVLRQAGVRSAVAVVANVDNDLLDVEIALEARAVRPGVRVIMRAFNEDFDRGLEQVFGPETAFSASALAAPTFAAAVISRNIEQVLPVAGQLLGVMQGSVPLVASTTPDIERAYGVRVLKRARETIAPTVTPRHRGTATRSATPGLVGPVTTLTLLGPLDGLERARVGLGIPAIATPAHFTPSEGCDTVLICGLGKVGYRVVRLLHHLPDGPRIVVITTAHPDDLFLRRIRELDDVTIVPGDARDGETLRSAGLDRAFTVAALTSDDQTNVQIAIEARRLRSDVHVVLRVFRSGLANKLGDLFGIHTTFSTSNLASATLASAALLSGTRRAFALDDQLFGMLDVAVKAGDQLAGSTVAALRDSDGATIVGLTRDGAETALPAPALTLRDGDVATVLAPLATLARLSGATIGR